MAILAEKWDVNKQIIWKLQVKMAGKELFFTKYSEQMMIELVTISRQSNSITKYTNPRNFGTSELSQISWESKVPPPKATPPPINKALLRDY